MSSNSFDSECPNCGGQMNCSSENRPHDSVSGICIECGFTFWTDRGISSLDEVNDERKDMELKPLKKLKKGKGMEGYGLKVN